MKGGENKTARLLITRLAVQVRPGEPESSRPYNESCKAFSGYGEHRGNTGNAIKSNFVQLFRFGVFPLPSLFVLPITLIFLSTYTFDSFTGAWRIHIEGKD